jgi:hypothetical protein
MAAFTGSVSLIVRSAGFSRTYEIILVRADEVIDCNELFAASLESV